MTLNAFKLIVGIGENVDEDNMDIVAAFSSEGSTMESQGPH